MLSTRPNLGDLLTRCRDGIAVSASQHVDRRLADDELRQTPEKYFSGQKTQWIQKFKGSVIPHLHQDSKYGKQFQKFTYSDKYAEKSFRLPFNTIAIEITIFINNELEKKKKVSVDEWIEI